MNLPELPAERDLPPGRAARMRAGLLTEARGRPRRVPRRLLVAATAVVTLVAGAATALEVRRDDRTRILAMTTGELDPEMRTAVDDCLGTVAPPAAVPVTPSDLTVAARQGGQIAVLFLNEAGYLACEVHRRFGQDWSRAVSGEAWPQRDWLPGPVQRLLLTSTDPDSGSVSVLGRVSARVGRLVLEHGNGHTTTARINEGAFGLVSRTDDVRPDAELVSYDATGREIDRRLLFRPSDRYEHCYTGPDGKVIYGEPGPGCRPADPWTG